MNIRVLKIFRKAKGMLNEQSQVKELIWQVSQKLKKINGSKKQIDELMEHVQLFLRMIKKSLSGEYSAFSHKTLFSLVFGKKIHYYEFLGPTCSRRLGRN